jgi:hypothetical protein
MCALVRQERPPPASWESSPGRQARPTNAKALTYARQRDPMGDFHCCREFRGFPAQPQWRTDTCHWASLFLPASSPPLAPAPFPDTLSLSVCLPFPASPHQHQTLISAGDHSASPSSATSRDNLDFVSRLSTSFAARVPSPAPVCLKARLLPSDSYLSPSLLPPPARSLSHQVDLTAALPTA